MDIKQLAESIGAKPNTYWTIKGMGNGVTQSTSEILYDRVDLGKLVKLVKEELNGHSKLHI